MLDWLAVAGAEENRQEAVDQAYFESDCAPVYMMSQVLRKRLLKQLDTAGRRVFPEIQDGKLLGLNLVITADKTAAAGDTAVICGSIKRLAFVHDVRPALIKSAERYAEFFQTFYGILHRLGVKLVDANADPIGRTRDAYFTSSSA
jgi:HK97 family phage major capsid protein